MYLHSSRSGMTARDIHPQLQATTAGTHAGSSAVLAVNLFNWCESPKTLPFHHTSRAAVVWKRTAGRRRLSGSSKSRETAAGADGNSISRMPLQPGTRGALSRLQLTRNEGRQGATLVHACSGVEVTLLPKIVRQKALVFQGLVFANLVQRVSNEHLELDKRLLLDLL